ncbi:MAG: helix-turn-helix domain-containing protein [Lachnospiraceae bacterium]|nr:helix-turn-helix domain-containing protein [Lachnospiraceae bacterium]
MKAVYISLDVRLTGQRIHDVMIERGYTVRQIQEILDLSCPHPVYKWIHGCCIPSTDNLYRLSKILGVSMEDLLVEVGTGDKVDEASETDEAVDKSENETE